METLAIPDPLMDLAAQCALTVPPADREDYLLMVLAKGLYVEALQHGISLETVLS